MHLPTDFRFPGSLYALPCITECCIISLCDPPYSSGWDLQKPENNEGWHDAEKLGLCVLSAAVSDGVVPGEGGWLFLRYQEENQFVI